jgi:hypothetical protein
VRRVSTTWHFVFLAVAIIALVILGAISGNLWRLVEHHLKFPPPPLEDVAQGPPVSAEQAKEIMHTDDEPRVPPTLRPRT